MNRVKAKVVINGKTQWVSAESVQKLVDAALQTMNTTPTCPTFEEYASNYISLYKENGSIQRNTLIGYKGYLNNHLIPFFGHMALTDITPNVLQRYINLKSKNYTTKTITEHLTLLHLVLDSAVEDRMIDRNPCDSQRLSMVGKKSSKVKAYTIEEFKALEGLLERLTGTDKLYLALSLYTGMRQGEMFALQWSDIDLEKETISVTKSVEWPCQNKGEIKEPKTDNGKRIICIIPQLLVVLSEQYCKDGYVLTSAKQTKGEPMTRQGVKRLNERINYISPVRFLSHRARHTVATFMNNAGADDVSITSTLGHSDVVFTKRQYVTSQTHQLQAAMTKFSAYIGTNLE